MSSSSLAGKEYTCKTGDPSSILGQEDPWRRDRLPTPVFLVAQMVKDLPALWETWVQSLGWEDPPGGGHGNPLQDSCLENPHGQRSQVGYSPWGRKVGHD